MNNLLGRDVFKLIGISAFLLLGLCGCVNHVAEVNTYRQVLDGPKLLPVHVEPDAMVTLTDAIRLANRNSEQLNIQGETYLQSLITKDRDFANFLPTLTLSPGYTVQDVHGLPGTPASSATASLGLTQNIFNGFRDYYTLRANDQSIEQQRQLLLDLQQTVVLDVIQAYYNVLTNEQSVDVLTNSLKVQRANVAFIQAQEAVGAAKPLDTAQAEAQASQTKVSLNSAIAAVRNGRIMLAYLCDAPIENNPLLDDFDPPQDVQSQESWDKEAEAKRQDLLAANANVRSARENVEVAFGQYYPSLTLNFNYFVYKEFDPSSAVWNGVLLVNLPIFDAGVIHADVRNAWSLFRQAALTQSQLRRSVDQDVDTAFVNLNLARQQLAELSIQVIAARDALFRAQELYRTGGGTFLDVLTAQDTLLTTQLQLTQQQFTQKTAYFNLVRTAGQLQLTIAQSQETPEQRRLQNLATQPVTEPSPESEMPLTTEPSTEPLNLPGTDMSTQPSADTSTMPSTQP